MCCISWYYQNKLKNGDVESKKNYYWSKNGKGMKNAIENHFNMWKIIIEIIIVFLILLIPIIFFYEKYNYEPLNDLLSSEAFWNLVELNISILTIISVIIIFKKDYYLGISIRDVMVLYDIPDVVLRVLVGSSFIFLLYGIYNVKKIRSSYISHVVEILVYIIMFYIILSVLVVIYKTADLLINSSKKEMKAFQCLRYKIAYGYRLDKQEVISNYAVEKISTYLVNEILKYYKYIKGKNQELDSIQFDSTILIINENSDFAKKYTRVFRCWGIIFLCACTSLYLALVYNNMKQDSFRNISNKDSNIFKVEIFCTIVLIIIGNFINVWILLLYDNFFWVFNFKEGKSRIANSGHGLYHQRFQFIGTVEDLIGFYKMLLYHNQGKEFRCIVIDKVKERLCKSNEPKIGNAILLLFHYMDYEKCYANLEKKGKVKKIEERSIKRLKQKDSYNYTEMMKLLEGISPDSVEYQFADSILKHVYKESEITENGMINPKKLRNYKFEKYFWLMKNSI